MQTPATDFDALSPPEQVLHVQALWDRIAAHPDSVPVSDAERAVLDERLTAHRADPAQAEDWTTVRARIRKHG